MNLIYLVNARLPTEKAHGYQIIKMCEALALNGVEVALWHPFRYQTKLVNSQNVFSFYGVQPIFKVKALANIDVGRWERFLPNSIFRYFFFGHVLIWGLYATLKAHREKANFYYTRDLVLAFWLTAFNLPTIYEEHIAPTESVRWLVWFLKKRPSLKLIVVVTSFLKKNFMTIGFSENKFLVAADAADLKLFGDQPPKKECRQKLNLPQEKFIIGYIGRFESYGKEKGVRELIKAAARLKKITNINFLLLCVGGPPAMIDNYRRLAIENGLTEAEIKFFDHQPVAQIPYWIKACDVVTIPLPWTEFSAYYTSPAKLFEYMAVGIPIIASDLPSLREVLNEQNAFLTPPGNIEAMALAIKKIAENPKEAEKVAFQAQQDVKGYSWVARVRQILDRV